VTVATCLTGRSLPAPCAVAAAGDANRAAAASAADALPIHSARGYASPLHGMVYNERPHEWLLDDPLDKDAVQYVRSSAVDSNSECSICRDICMKRRHLMQQCSDKAVH
jgi:hypothetical protein